MRERVQEDADHHRGAIPLITVTTYEPFFLPIENCNRDATNKRIMPARSKLQLPAFSPEEAPAAARALAGKKVAVFGSPSPKLGEGQLPASVGPVTQLAIGYVCLMADDEQRSKASYVDDDGSCSSGRSAPTLRRAIRCTNDRSSRNAIG